MTTSKEDYYSNRSGRLNQFRGDWFKSFSGKISAAREAICRAASGQVSPRDRSIGCRLYIDISHLSLKSNVKTAWTLTWTPESSVGLNSHCLTARNTESRSKG